VNGDFARLESNLRRMYQAAAAALPDTPNLSWDEYRMSGKRRESRWRGKRLAVLGAAMLGVGVGATGIAAAAGAFVSTTRPPQRPPLATGTVLTRPQGIPIGKARGLTLSTDGYSAPNEVIRFTGPGPDGTTFTVVSASTHPYSGCTKLVVTSPPATRDRSISGGCSAAANVNRPLPTTSATDQHYGTSHAVWRSSPARSTLVWFGQAASDATLVKVFVAPSWSAPYKQVVSVKTSLGWFAVSFAVPRGDIYTVKEYGADGRVITTLGGSSPLGGKSTLPSSTSQSPSIGSP
jgi:hypothetical protein